MNHAWVESPLQLLNAVEWAAERREPVVIGLREDVASLAPLARWLDTALEATGHTEVTLAWAATPWAAGLRDARRRIIGDAFSGQFRILTALASTRDVTVLDDGTATLHLARVLSGDEPFARMGQREHPPARALGEAARIRLRRAARAGRLSLFTAYADHPSVTVLTEHGVRVEPNRYAWLRGVRDVPHTAVGPRVVLGSALVPDGYISEANYLTWVADAARGAAHYLPHRRETPALLAKLADHGATVVTTDLPAEVVLACAPGLEEVVSLPSSTRATLAAILPDAVRHRTVSVPEAWWTPAADVALRSVLTPLDTQEQP
ncbi:hypothetical protein [Demequina soli]|uniref:hypothetical protein n=1 Tax=Demequina soli TaxID=1638987 RepID=UPI00078351E0|nr:hypothetical protein [Demequina soli]